MSSFADRQAKASERRKRCILLAVLVLSLGLLVSSLRWSSYYCRFCGMRRRRVTLNPASWWQDGLVLSERTEDTPLSMVLLPLMEDGTCDHEWVLRSQRSAVTIHAYPDASHADYYLGGVELFQNLASFDPELALAAARILLYPYATNEEFEKHARPLVESLAGPARPNLEQWRRIRETCGLDPAVQGGNGGGPRDAQN